MATVEIVGVDHKAITVADDLAVVSKFYLEEDDWRQERTNLQAIERLQQQGFGTGSFIPRILEDAEPTRWKIGGTVYDFRNRMERIPGISADLALPGFSLREVSFLGRNLGNAAFAMHATSKVFIKEWAAKHGQSDKLLDYIIDHKAARVLGESTDQTTKDRVNKAVSYLKDKQILLAKEVTLSHLDFSLSNTQVERNGRVGGLIGWTSFGLTNPSLSLYQLTDVPIWYDIKWAYLGLGDRIREDVTYAAAVIHLAWSPLVRTQLGLQIDHDSAKEKLDSIYSRFQEQAEV